MTRNYGVVGSVEISHAMPLYVVSNNHKSLFLSRSV